MDFEFKNGCFIILALWLTSHLIISNFLKLSKPQFLTKICNMVIIKTHYGLFHDG